MSKSSSCVDWFISCQRLDVLVENISLCLHEDEILCGICAVVEFSLRECSYLPLKILAALITYAVVRRVLVLL